MGRIREHLRDHAAHLRELLHQVLLGVEASRRVDDHDLGPARDGGADRVERDGRRVRSVLVLAHDLRAVALGPDLELVGRSGPEGVAGPEQDALALLAEAVGDLGDGGGLPRAVDAHHEDDGWSGVLQGELPPGVEARPEPLPQGGAHVVLPLELAAPVAALDLLDELGGQGTEVGRVEHLLELREQVRVDRTPAPEETGDGVREGGAGAGEAGLEAVEQAHQSAPSAAAARSWAIWRTLSRIPFTNAPVLAVEKRFPSSMPSLMLTLGGTSGS